MSDRRPENYSTYLRAKKNLDEIAEQVKASDLPLEKALDLYEEAVRLGNRCADLIDVTDFSLEEISAFTGEPIEESSQAQGEQESNPDDRQAENSPENDTEAQQ